MNDKALESGCGHVEGAHDYPRERITGVVLAGGLARRMGGGDKGLTQFDGKAMAAHVADALSVQCAQVMINANRNLESYRELGYPVFTDEDSGAFNGPLAGIAAGLVRSATPWVLFAPCDSPLVSSGLGAALWSALHASGADIAMAGDGERHHPVFALLRATLADSAREYLSAGERKIDRWYAEHATITVALPAFADTFLNINRPDDLAHLESRLVARADRST